MSHLDDFIEASGAKPEVKEEFKSLVDNLPELSSDPRTAAIQVKKFLFENEFIYDENTFLIQDVLAKREGNCIGLPMLISTILGEKGYDPRLVIQTATKDLTKKYEDKLFDALKTACKKLATVDDISPDVHFVPKEHYVIEIDGTQIETTTVDTHDAFDCESEKSVSFKQGISNIYKDRAVHGFLDGGLSSEEYISLLKKSVEILPSNRTANALLAMHAFENFDDDMYHECVGRFRGAYRDDSLQYFLESSFCNHTNSLENLNKTLDRYPSYGAALSSKAAKLSESDPEEAMYLFKLASHCSARSRSMSLGNFYAVFADKLEQLFGKVKVMDELYRFSEDSIDSQEGCVIYDLALWNLDGNIDDLADAFEHITTPLDELKVLNAARGTELEDPKKMAELDQKYGHSSLYKEIKEDLNRT